MKSWETKGVFLVPIVILGLLTKKRAILRWLWSITKKVKKCKKKWGVDSTLDIILILIVFSLAGMSIVFVRKPVFNILGINDVHIAMKTAVYLLIIFPCYQAFLLIYGALLGQFKFFWDKEKKMGRWIINFVSKKFSEK